MKRFKSALAAVLAASIMLASCGGGGGGGPTTGSSGPSTDVYRQLYGSELTTLDYVATGTTVEYSLLSNTVDGLVDFDRYGNPAPALAERWEHNDDYTEWKFYLRQGVMWYDYKGEELGEATAHDFVTAAKYANEAETDASNQYMFEFVKNAQLYFEQSADRLEAANAVADKEAASIEDFYVANGINPDEFIAFDEVGVKAEGDYTVVYTMEAPCTFFLSCLSYNAYLPIYGPLLEEAGSSFGTDITNIAFNGAYIFSEYEPNVKRTLTKNENYWDAENVGIKRIEYIYNADEVTIAPTMARNGEVDFAIIGADILDSWMKAEGTKDIIHNSMPNPSFAYFYNFNFEPRFDAQYEPDNWLIAVNNENFRKSMFHALDRVKAISVYEPYDPQKFLINTITPRTFTMLGSVDYTELGNLNAISSSDSFSASKALEYKELAIPELEAAGATFPIKVLMPYNPATTDWDKECQVVQQQMQDVLGRDYIEIIIEAGPATGFLSAIRRTGNYAFMKCNWGADYADPATWTEAFTFNNSYGFFYTNENRVLSEKPATNKTAATQAIVDEYYSLIDAAKEIPLDFEARYNAFANAEAFLIDHAFAVPFYMSREDGYTIDRIDPFTIPYAPFGVSRYHYKGRVILDKSMGMDEYQAAYDKWHSEWKSLQK
ncbi:MAG: ABC transporter substrate-binding protein [Eubacteriaceae bacterium]|nr:ABC transporter substrate-binding protein [Eubacteriaceae bacterium]